MEEFSSILDTKNNIWEFIYTPEKKDKEIIKRKFDFIYEWKKYECSFEKSSRYLKFFAESFRLLKSETKTSYRNLRQFKDYYSKDKFVNLGVSDVHAGYVFLPLALDGGYEQMSSSYISLSNNYKYNNLSVGYGLSFSKNICDLASIVSKQIEADSTSLVDTFFET